MKRNWLARVIRSDNNVTVYLAVSKAVQKDFAKPIIIKSTRLGMLLSPLQTEDRVLNSFFAIPEIIQSHGHEITREDNGMPMFNLFLEHAPHGTLADLIKIEPFLETELATKVYIAMLLRGLSCLHRKGFTHCDFKPDNILVFPGGYYPYQLKIAEFGKARTPEENFDPGLWRLKFRGTSWYMSPESVAHGLIEAPLDIWSFGCVVIEMITGHNAWGTEISETEIMVKLGFMQEPPNPPNGISEECYDFLDKCFVIDPNQRWTADMLLNHPYLLEAI